MSIPDDPQLAATLALVHSLAYATSLLPPGDRHQVVQASRRQALESAREWTPEHRDALTELLDRFDRLVQRYELGYLP